MNLKLILILGALLGACAKGPASVITSDPIFNRPQGDSNRPLFQDVSASVFEPKCVSCHGSTKAAGGVFLDSYASVKSNLNLVRDEVATGSMPPRRRNDSLSAEQKDLVLRWIDQGAVEF